MNPRIRLSIILISAGFVLAVLPLKYTRSLGGSPAKLLSASLNDSLAISADQLARFISLEDKDIHLVDLRDKADFMKTGIPGAVNVPYHEILEKDPSSFLLAGNARNIFYSSDDLQPGYAMIIAMGLGYRNSYFLRGGINEWTRVVSDTIYRGGTITARENALFESRIKAGRLYNKLCNLPDSLKIKYLNAMKFNPKKLDGGCE